MNRIAILALSGTVGVLALTGCNTVSGLGRDMAIVGNQMSRTADTAARNGGRTPAHAQNACTAQSRPCVTETASVTRVKAVTRTAKASKPAKAKAARTASAAKAGAAIKPR